MENVVLSFGMVAILDIDADSQFKNVFKYMCASLRIIYWTLARGNHKGTSIEKYHRFLKKNWQLKAKKEARMTSLSIMRKPINTPGISPQSRAHIFS